MFILILSLTISSSWWMKQLISDWRSHKEADLRKYLKIICCICSSNNENEATNCFWGCPHTRHFIYRKFFLSSFSALVFTLTQSSVLHDFKNIFLKKSLVEKL